MNSFLQAAGSVYGAVARARRAWYGCASRRRRLKRPVVSVGNLRAGGSGKTPVVEAVARILLARGERPAILTRGYGRRHRTADVTVVSDGRTVLADVTRAGDEPLMLARHLPGVMVLVGADRYRSGLVAEGMGATVHLLDDGFQHLALARSVDLLLAGVDDLSEPVLPAGYLREPLSAAADADALLVPPGTPDPAALGRALGIDPVFRMTRALGAPAWTWSGGAVPHGALISTPTSLDTSTPVFVLAGIARPERFLRDLADAGWTVTGAATFRDHHWFTPDELGRVTREARASGAGAIVTTEKDAARLEACDLSRLDLPLAVLPLTASVEPAEAFEAWLVARLREEAR